MVDDTKNIKDRTSARDSGNDKSLEQRSKETDNVATKSHRGIVPRSNSPSHDRLGTDLIPTLEVVLASVEKAVRPPIGKNKQLAQSIRMFRAALGKLPRLSDSEFIEIIEKIARERPHPSKTSEIEFDLHALRNLTLEEIEHVIADPNVSKKHLLAIVRERFGGSTGTLAKLSLVALLERVGALAMNERSHETVARLASGDANSQSIELETPDSRQ